MRTSTWIAGALQVSVLSSFSFALGCSASSESVSTAGMDLSADGADTTPTPPPQAKAAGFTDLVFDATFDTLNLCNTGTGKCTWYNPGIYWQNPATGASTPNNKGDVLNLPWNTNEPNYHPSNTTVGTMAANGENTTSWLHFYVEISMSFPPTTGVWPALWLENNAATTSYVPKESSTHHYGELDVFEWQSQSPGVFNGTIHDWSGSPVKDVESNNGHNTANLPSGTKLADYNTYGVLWTETEIQWYFNNKLLLSATSSTYPAAFAILNASPMYLMLGNQAGSNWGGSGSKDPTSETVMKVQWVHVWQK
jgi:beta-glucanase (GH16 family)